MRILITNVFRALKQPRTLVLAAGLTLFASGAFAEGPTSEIAECIGEAWGEGVECVDDLPFYLDFLCALRFESDIILCVLLGGLPAG